MSKKISKTQLKRFKKRTLNFIKRNKVAILIVFLVIAFIVPYTIALINTEKYTYDGLQEEKPYPPSSYDMDAFFQDEYNLKNYRKGPVIGIPGIDVSVHQGNIDWEKVKDSGVKFAMIRIGYSSSKDGKIYKDNKFDQNIEGATKAGLKVGVYFFSQAINREEAINEAKYVLDNIKGCEISMPVAFDMEPFTGSDRISNLGMSEKTEIADAFCTIIEKNEYEAMVYGNPTWLNQTYDFRYLTDYDIWLAHYNPSTDYQNEFIMWQYADWGKVAGIDTNVDLNVYFRKIGRK